MVAIATHARGVFTTNVFGDTSINAAFSFASTTGCTGNVLTPTNTSSGNIKYYKWTVTPSTHSYVNGTDSSSSVPQIKLLSNGTYSFKLVCSDSLGLDKDSMFASNLITVSSESFKPWIQNFDTINAVSGTRIDSVWNLSSGANYVWAIDSNATTTTSTGPSADYSGSGHYLYAEASTPAVQNDQAIIQTGCIFVPDTGIFSFAYHMYGSDMGSLAFEVDSGGGWQEVSRLDSAQQPSSASPWKIASHDLNTFNNASLKIRLVATRGSSYDSDIGIDQLVFKNELTYCDKIKPVACLPNTSSLLYDDGVYGVKIDTVEYTSSGCNTDGAYTNRVCQDTFVVSDTGFVLYVNAGNSYSNRTRVFIDFNNDGAFDTTSEMVWYSAKTIGYRNSAITIPSTATKNTFLRMRVMADDNSNMPNNSCATLSYGES